ncbi:hypothetical protein A2U01_0003723, partial [Trifolium medium]|nr:hypothetical protein [Trifolium medium]
MGNDRGFSGDHVCDDLCSNLRFLSFERFIGEVVGHSLRDVPVGGGFSSEPLPSSSNGDLIDPFVDPWIESRRRSFEIGSVVTMVKNWTAEDYVFPHDRALIPWVTEKIEGVPSKYSNEGSLSSSVVDVGPSDDWHVLLVEGDDRLCSRFDRDCVVPMYKCLFKSMGLCFPLCPFEVGVINHLRICPSQLHPLSWAHVRAFKYWCECVGSSPTVPLFFSYFTVVRTNSDPGKDQGLITLRQKKSKMWTQYVDSFKWELDEYFLVGSRHAEAHNCLCVVNPIGDVDSNMLSDTDDEVG